MSTFYYSGGFSTAIDVTYPYINGKYYETGYVEVVFLYGNFVKSDNPQAVPPPFLPVMPSNLPVHAELYHAGSWNNPAMPTSKDSNAFLIFQQDIFDQDNPRNCLGKKFVFVTRVFADYRVDQSPYCVVFSIDNVEIPYGFDTIVVGPQSVISDTFGPDW